MILSALADSSADMFCFRIWNKRSVSGSLNWMLFDFAEFMAESRNGIISLMSVGFLAVAKFMRNCSFSGDISARSGLLFKKS